jgi:hypothetical protein
VNYDASDKEYPRYCNFPSNLFCDFWKRTRMYPLFPLFLTYATPIFECNKKHFQNIIKISKEYENNQIFA